MRAVNLIPTEARRAGPGVQSGGLGPGFAVLGLLGVALLLVTVYVLTSNTISDRKVKLAAPAGRGHPGAGGGQPAGALRHLHPARPGARGHRHPDRADAASTGTPRWRTSPAWCRRMRR